IPQVNLQVEADLLFTPAKIGERGVRPMAMYLLILADKDSGMVLGIEAMTTTTSLAELHAQFPETLVRLLLQIEILPQRLILRSKHLLSLLKPLPELLGI